MAPCSGFLFSPSRAGGGGQSSRRGSHDIRSQEAEKEQPCCRSAPFLHSTAQDPNQRTAPLSKQVSPPQLARQDNSYKHALLIACHKNVSIHADLFPRGSLETVLPAGVQCRQD